MESGRKLAYFSDLILYTVRSKAKPSSMNNVGHTANNFAVNYSAYPQWQIPSGYKLYTEVKLEKQVSTKHCVQVYAV